MLWETFYADTQPSCLGCTLLETPPVSLDQHGLVTVGEGLYGEGPSSAGLALLSLMYWSSQPLRSSAVL